MIMIQEVELIRRRMRVGPRWVVGSLLIDSNISGNRQRCRLGY